MGKAKLAHKDGYRYVYVYNMLASTNEEVGISQIMLQIPYFKPQKRRSEDDLKEDKEKRAEIQCSDSERREGLVRLHQGTLGQIELRRKLGSAGRE